MSYLGDRPFGQTLYAKFTTVNASGVPTTLGNTPSLAYMVDNDTTLYTSGLAITADYASKTGLNAVSAIVTTSCTGMVSGTDVQIVIAAGTVSGVSMIGYLASEFSINKEAALKPATVGRTLAVAATGGAAIDWASVGNPSSTVSLSATTLNLVTTATNLTNAPTSGDFTATMKTSLNAATPAVTVSDKTGFSLSAAGITAIWAEVMTGTTTAVQAMRGFIAALLGKASGLNANAPVYRNIADTKNVISATTDADGDRTAVTLDLT